MSQDDREQKKGTRPMARKISPDDILEPRPEDARADMRFLAGLEGFPFYRGIRCRREHPGLRRTSTGECTGCVARRHRQWKLRHPAAARARTNDHLRALGKLPLSVVSTPGKVPLPVVETAIFDTN